jgi:AcrR family transcriptional regulator
MLTFMNSRSPNRKPAEKAQPNQRLVRRAPRQQRSLDKIELMFEATMRLIEEGDIASLTTNAVAAHAGVSIGTLYQYFDGKESLLDALTTRELGVMHEEFLRTLQDGVVPARPGDRIRQLVRIVTGAYGGRERVHRQLLEHALTKGTSGRMSPTYEQITAMFATQGVTSADGRVHKLTPAQAFVVTHATVGVLRTLAAQENPPPIKQVEDALVQVVYGYITGLSSTAPCGA